MSLMHIAFETLIRCKAVAGLLLYCLEITSGHLHLSTLADYCELHTLADGLEMA